MKDTPTLKMLEALNNAVKAVRKHHAGIPDVILTLGSGSGKTHGHFGPKFWRERDAEEGKVGAEGHEINMATESFSRGGVETMGTLIHELVHAYCHAEDIQDTSNSGRYHNTRFKKAANELGITVEQAGSIGWSKTSVPEATQRLYKAEIDALDAALVAYRKAPSLVKLKSSSKDYKMECPTCLDPVRVSKKWFTNNQPMCSCGEPFEFYVVE